MLREYLDLPRSIHILCLGSFVNRAGSFVMVFLTIYISEKLGFSRTFAARCMGAFGFGCILASLIGGQLTDQIGRKIVMVTSLVFGAVLLIALSFAHSPTSVLLTVAAYGLVAEMFRPACSAMIGDLTRTDQRPSAFGLYYIAINLGFACGPPIGGILADYSYQLLFWADAITMVVFAIILVVCVAETRSLASDDPEQASANDHVSIPLAVRRIISDKPFLLFCCASLLIGLVFVQGFSALPIFIKNAGYSNWQFGLLMAVNGIMIFVCQLPLTHYLERFAPMSNMTWGTALMAIGFGVYAISAAPWLLILAVLIWTTGEMMQAPFKQTVVTDMAPPELRGRYLGAIGMCFAVALTVGAPLGGEVLERMGARALWIGCFAIALLSVGVYAAAHRQVVAKNVG